MRHLKKYIKFFETQEFVTPAGRWRVKNTEKPKDTIDLNDVNSKINLDTKYIFSEVEFEPKLNTVAKTYFALIQKKASDKETEKYPSWVIYASNLEELKLKLKKEIPKYNKALLDGTIFD